MPALQDTLVGALQLWCAKEWPSHTRAGAWMLPSVLVPGSYFLVPKVHDGVYLNINMGHEFWPETSMEFMKIANGRHPMIGCAFVVACGTLLNMLAWWGGGAWPGRNRVLTCTPAQAVAHGHPARSGLGAGHRCHGTQGEAEAPLSVALRMYIVAVRLLVRNGTAAGPSLLRWLRCDEDQLPGVPPCAMRHERASSVVITQQVDLEGGPPTPSAPEAASGACCECAWCEPSAHALSGGKLGQSGVACGTRVLWCWCPRGSRCEWGPLGWGRRCCCCAAQGRAGAGHGKGKEGGSVGRAEPRGSSAPSCGIAVEPVRSLLCLSGVPAAGGCGFRHALPCRWVARSLRHSPLVLAASVVQRWLGWPRAGGQEGGEGVGGGRGRCQTDCVWGGAGGRALWRGGAWFSGGDRTSTRGRRGGLFSRVWGVWVCWGVC